MAGSEISIIFLILVAGVIGLGCMVFWIWMLIDCATKESTEGNDKIVWVIIIAVAQLLGAILYFFVRRPKRIRETGQ